MADARAKAVYGRLVDLHSRAKYLADQVTQLREPIKNGDAIDVPLPASLTVGSAVDGSGNMQNVSAQAHGLTVATLTANLQPMINVQLPLADDLQVMDGAFANALALNALQQLRGSIDDTFVTYLMSLAYTTNGTYHDNVAAGTLTPNNFLDSVGRLDRAGSMRENMVFFISPEAAGQLAALQQYTHASGDGNDSIGTPMIGKIFGIPVFSSRSIVHRRTIATTAYDITSNVLTLTVASGHNLVPGQFITFDTVTAGGDMSVATAIASVAATTITVNWTATNSSATEAGTITTQDSTCLLVDAGATFVALQKVPGVRRVEVADRAADNLQIHALWGRIGVAGHVRAIHL